MERLKIRLSMCIGKVDQLKMKKNKTTLLTFPIKPGMPLYDWYKSNKKEFKQVASIDDMVLSCSKFVSEKQLRKMSEGEVEFAPGSPEKGLL